MKLSKPYRIALVLVVVLVIGYALGQYQAERTAAATRADLERRVYFAESTRVVYPELPESSEKADCMDLMGQPPDALAQSAAAQ